MQAPTIKRRDDMLRLPDLIAKGAGALRMWYLRSKRTVGEIVTLALKRNRSREAIVAGKQRITYGELAQDVYRAVGLLASHGITRGNRVASILPDSAESIILRLACYVAGVEIVLFDKDMPHDTLRQLIELTQPMVLFRNGTPPNTGIKEVVFARDKLPEYAVTVPKLAPRPETPASISFTSGSTGLPKAVRLTQGNWAASCHAVVRAAEPSMGRRQQAFLAVIPMAVAGSTTIVPALLGGMKIVIAGSADPGTVAGLVGREHITHLFLTPCWLSRLTRYVRHTGAATSSLEKIAVGTDTVHAATMKRAIETFGPIVSCGYGMAEVLPPLFMLSHREYMAGGVLQEKLLHSVGRSYPHAGIALVNDSGVPVAPRERGHVRFASPTKAAGYLGNDEENRKRFVGRYFYSEDIACMDEEGYLYLLGRDSHKLACVNGKDVFARSVEDIFLENGEAGEACAVRVGDAVVIAYTSSRDETALVASAEEKAARLTGMAVHSRKVDALPTTAAGKVDRKGMPTLFEEA